MATSAAWLGGSALTSLGVTGTSTLNGGTITTSARQPSLFQRGDARQHRLADSSITGVDFVGTVDGAHALTVLGNATFSGTVGEHRSAEEP